MDVLPGPALRRIADLPYLAHVLELVAAPDRSNAESDVNMAACSIESTNLRRIYFSLCRFDFLLRWAAARPLHCHYRIRG